MWLSKQQKRVTPSGSVDTGEVTISDNSVAVELDSERRNLAVYAPGGYVWKPSVGQKVLVLKSEDGSSVVGTPVKADCAPGEISLRSEGGAQIALKNDSAVQIKGNVQINGEELSQMIERVAADLIADYIQ